MESIHSVRKLFTKARIMSEQNDKILEISGGFELNFLTKNQIGQNLTIKNKPSNVLLFIGYLLYSIIYTISVVLK